MNFQSIIAARRDGRRNTEAEFEFLAVGAAGGSIPDYQLAAWLMAAYLRPLDPQETAWLTQAMARSGDRIDLTGLPKPWVDKHSTGGVGDKTSLVLLPLLAACGLTVVKMSGRGLGITGGTIDKLSSVPGFRLDLSPEEMKRQAAEVGVAITGQSPDLAPADKALYALRDVTETVGSIPLIVSSILSKKIAGGAETVVLDVKCGSGAFMKSLQQARQLAYALRETAALCGLKTKVAISDMSQPLGSAAGNALEVREALSVLDPNTRLPLPSVRFRSLCCELAAVTLVAAEVASDRAKGMDRAVSALESGRAGTKASEWFVAQGARDPLSPGFETPVARVASLFAAGSAGWIKSIDAETVGRAVIDLGGGRKTKTDAIDLSVGIELHACVGSSTDVGTPLFTVHAASESEAKAIAEQVRHGIEFSDTRVLPIDPLLELAE